MRVKKFSFEGAKISTQKSSFLNIFQKIFRNELHASFLELQKKSFFLSGLAFTPPPPLSGLATKKYIFLRLPFWIVYRSNYFPSTTNILAQTIEWFKLMLWICVCSTEEKLERRNEKVNTSECVYVQSAQSAKKNWRFHPLPPPLKIIYCWILFIKESKRGIYLVYSKKYLN